MRKKLFSITLFSFSIFLLCYVLKGFKFEDFKLQTSKVEWRLVCFSAASMLLSSWFRNLRWLLLLHPLGFKIKRNQAFSALLLSYPANLIFPQSSFFVRATFLKKISGVSFGQCLGTIFAEKVMDGIVIFGLFFTFLFSKITFNYEVKYSDRFLLELGILGGIALILCSFLIKSFYFKFWSNAKSQVIGQMGKFNTGLKTILEITNKKVFLLYTILIWIPYFAIFYFLIKGSVLKDLIGFKLPLELAVMANIGWIFPTQGGLGSYHFCISKIMQINGFAKNLSVFFAFFSHTFIVMFDILLGFLVAILNLKVLKNIFWKN